MHMINQVSGLSASKILQKNGLMQRTNFAWFEDIDEPVFHGDRDAPHYICAAFTLQEMLIMMGDAHVTMSSKYDHLFIETEKTEAAFMMLLHLGIVPVTTANERLTKFYEKK